MAIDIIARGLATSLLGSDGKISLDKMPIMPSAPADATFFPIGGITDASQVAGKSVEEILLMMLYGVVNPTLTNPSLSIIWKEEKSFLTIGRPTVLEGLLIFDRGTIEPAYGTSGFRSGPPIKYTIMGKEIESSALIYNFSVEITPTEKEVVFTYRVDYDKGEQPLDVSGDPFSLPLEAGAIINSKIFTAIYPVYNDNKEDLSFDLFEDETGMGYISVFHSEQNDMDKQHFMLSKKVKVIGIKSFNILTQQWDWLGGTAEKSLTHFDTTLITGDSLGETEDYILYTHNQPRTGERELRIYIEY